MRTAQRSRNARRDAQASRVYYWESKWALWETPHLTLPQCRTIVRAACELWHVDTPTVVLARRDEDPNCSYYLVNERRIVLSPQHKNAATCLHEAAHHVVSELFTELGEDAADHGPEWCGVYVWLLERFRIAPREALVASALAHGLKWVDLSPDDSTTA